MDVSKFLVLLQTRSVFFARADLLGDPFEGSAPRADSELPRRLIEEYDGDELPEEIFGAKTKEKAIGFLDQISGFRKEMVTKMFVSCWHASDWESAAMWKLYSQSQDAVAIQTTYARLAAELPSDVFMGKVRYLDYERDRLPDINAFTPFMSKRRSFEHEREVRAVLWSLSLEVSEGASKEGRIAVGELGATVSVDLDKIIEAVFVSPAAPTWFADVVRDATAKYGVDVPVHHSSLKCEPMY